MHSLTTHRYRRIEESPSAVLSSLPGDNPLYVHARNWMSEMAVITPLTDSFTDEDGDWLSFPERGLNLFLPGVLHLHAISIDHQSRPSVALEIATPGEPRSVSFAAIPRFSDVAVFADALSRHPSQEMTPDEYNAWRTDHLIRPRACPCCADAAEDRRRDLSENPLSRIFAEAIEKERTLHCRLRSVAFGFSSSFVPSDLLLRKGRIAITSRDHMAMLEIDPGFCHRLNFNRCRIDAEPMTRLSVSNSLGETELVIETAGPETFAEWSRLCRPD